MFILSQEKNLIFYFNRFTTIYAQDIYREDKYRCTNVYGKFLLKKFFLGTYEDGEAEQVVAEIYRSLKNKTKYYTMPEVALDLTEFF